VHKINLQSTDCVHFFNLRTSEQTDEIWYGRYPESQFFFFLLLFPAICNTSMTDVQTWEVEVTAPLNVVPQIRYENICCHKYVALIYDIFM
jgi:hypothetical protein